MILVAAASRSEAVQDAAVLFAARLQARGHDAAVDARGHRPAASRQRAYAAAPVLADLSDLSPSRIIVIAADHHDAEGVADLRALAALPALPALAIGRFATRQEMIGARARLSFALGRDAGAIDLTAFSPRPILPDLLLPQFALAAVTGSPASASRGIVIAMPGAALSAAEGMAAVAALDHLARMRVSVVTDAQGQALIRASNLHDVPALRIDDLPPHHLAAMAAVLVVLDAPATPPDARDDRAHDGQAVWPGDRLAALVLDTLAAGRPVIDATAAGAIALSGAPVLRGPAVPATLAAYLLSVVLPHWDAIARKIARSGWLADAGFERLEQALGLTPSAPAVLAAARPGAEARRAVFVPTNGIGIGHAQRLAQIAGAMARRGDTAFAAFPSCVDLIARAGFPATALVPRSDAHDAAYANDILNFLRLRRLVRPGDALIFDGGYVFDSVHRTIRERGARGIWIRRGLWQPGQDATNRPERAGAFARVIVPQEAFGELNDPAPWGGPGETPVAAVGPVVRFPPPGGEFGRDVIRARLARSLGQDFDRLIVTMLGGGVAADRSAQLHAICHHAERRPGTLNLILVWPGSAVSPGLYLWKQSRVVRSLHALELCRAADLALSAAGYNSFHELIYAGVPAIFVPQMAPFMDDQDRRARAASDRGLARTVAAHEFVLLDRAMRDMLDEGHADDMRKALAAAALPATGTADAAAIIDAELVA